MSKWLSERAKDWSGMRILMEVLSGGRRTHVRGCRVSVFGGREKGHLCKQTCRTLAKQTNKSFALTLPLWPFRSKLMPSGNQKCLWMKLWWHLWMWTAPLSCSCFTDSLSHSISPTDSRGSDPILETSIQSRSSFSLHWTSFVRFNRRHTRSSTPIVFRMLFLFSLTCRSLSKGQHKQK